MSNTSLNPYDNPDLSVAARPQVVVVGGGLAGIAVAVSLAERNFPVTLLEARQHLGGRATSYTDPQSNEVIDNCQHVSMACCTNLKHLCQQLGISQHLFSTEKKLYFIDGDGRITRFGESLLPAPFHLTGSFLRLPYLTPLEKWRFALALRALASASPESLRGLTLTEWLYRHKQSDNLIHNVWEVVLISALSESLDRVDATYARKVFVDGFLSNRRGWRVEIPATSLDTLYSEQTQHTLKSRGVELRLNARVERFRYESERIAGVDLRDGRTVTGDEFVLAVPQHQVLNLLPPEVASLPVFQSLSKIDAAPITSVHFWLDRPIMQLPHAVLLGRLSQWVFNRDCDSSRPPRHRYQVVISASRNIQSLSTQELIDAVVAELVAIFPKCRSAQVLHARAITERRAVFSVTPGIDELRPLQQSPIVNLQLAGDWTQTGWPATMEGAVLSGYRAAENVLSRYHLQESIVQPPLPTSWLSRLLLGIR